MKNSAKSKKPTLATGRGKLFKANCITLMRSMRSESIDCIFADPPFNLKKDYGPGIDDDLKESSYLKWSEEWMSESVRILKPGGSFFLYNLPKWNLLLGAWLSSRLEFRNWIAVDIKFSLPIPKRLYPTHYSL